VASYHEKCIITTDKPFRILHIYGRHVPQDGRLFVHSFMQISSTRPASAVTIGHRAPGMPAIAP